MHGNTALAAQSGLLPDGLIEGLGGIDLAGVGHKQMQYGILRRGQAHRLPLHGDGLGAVIQGNTADGQGLLVLRAAVHPGIPPQLRADAGQHLHRHKGLGNIVICTNVEPQDLILGLGLRRQQNNGCVGKFPNFGCGRHAVHDGHHHIQQNQIHGYFPAQLHRLLAVVGLVQVVSFRGQIDFQRVYNILLIVTNQNPIHIHSSVCSPSATIIPFPFLIRKRGNH